MHIENCTVLPGSTRLTFARNSDAFAPNPAERQSSEAILPTCTVARYALDFSWGRQPLPLVTDTLPLAEAVRSALLYLHRQEAARSQGGGAGGLGAFSRTFSGKDEERRPLAGHGHAYYLPADEDGDGRIDHVTVVAADGFAADEIRALDRFRQVRFGGGEPLRMLFVWLGREGDFRTPLFGPAASWISATPFVATRYPKLRGRKRDPLEHRQTPQGFAGHVLGEELGRLSERRMALPGFAIEELTEGIGARRLRSIQFQRFRRKGSDDGGRRPAGGFRIRFAFPVAGPLALGHSCHFGLGLFLPEPSQVAQP